MIGSECQVRAERVVVTGCSGAVGRELVPGLLANGVEVVLVGRDPVALRDLFPACQSVHYDEITIAGKNFDALIHLATMNNNVKGAYDQFRKVNVDLAVLTRNLARQAGIRRFVYVSSTHALNLADTSHYAVSKREAEHQLMDGGDDIEILYLPAVVGRTLSGKLRLLSHLPGSLRSVALSVLASLSPTVSPHQVISAVLRPSPNRQANQSPWIETNGQVGNWFFALVKRSVDLFVATTVLIFLGWLLVLIGIAIRVESPGPALFRQVRVGRQQRTFTCLKLRTMHIHTPNAGTHEVAASSVTGLGAFLRRTKLDELPQVINVLLNQMSLVGPRPSLPSQTEVIAARAKVGVDVLKPGITGLSQCRGIDMSTPNQLAISDSEYLKLQSLVLDGKIMVQTALGKGSGDKVRVA